MAITYPAGDTTPKLKYARMVRRHKRLIQMFNMFGKWHTFNSNKWYIVRFVLPTLIGKGWKGGDAYFLKKVRINGITSYATKAEADTAFATLSNQNNKAVGQFGLTQTRYNTLPANAQTKFPFKNKLNEAEWLVALAWLTAKRIRITDELLIQRVLVEDDSTGDNDVTDV